MAVTMLYAGERDDTLGSKRCKLIGKTGLLLFPDEAGNRFLLRRAERLYRELPFMERDMLSQLLDGFEQVLEMREPSAIEMARRHLEEFLDRFEPDTEPPEA